jgi:2-aminoethylphosphonate-pyruvate transaminase
MFVKLGVGMTQPKLLFTPGPLTTSDTIKEAMRRDVGSRDEEFIEIVREIRRRLVALAGVNEEEFTAILIQGSGTFGIEAVISSTIPPDGKLLVVVNGAYGRRIAQIATRHRIALATIEYAEDCAPRVDDVADALARDSTIMDVAIVHCETTSGIINPIAPIGAVVKQAGRRYIVDAMSSFGAAPLNVAQVGIDYLISSANKCIEGVPGFSFVIANAATLLASKGWTRTVSLDLLAQWQGLEQDGQFRFTPPTHTLLAFHRALLELEEEGGVLARAARYQTNHTALIAGMRALGFVEYLRPEDQGYIITSFRYPTHSNFKFDRFYRLLSEKGFVIYPGKVTNADCFRIGHIGQIYPDDITALLEAIRVTLAEMNVSIKD